MCSLYFFYFSFFKRELNRGGHNRDDRIKIMKEIQNIYEAIKEESEREIEQTQEENRNLQKAVDKFMQLKKK